MSVSVLSGHVSAFLLACHARGLSLNTRGWYEWMLHGYVDYVEEGEWPWDDPSTVDRLFVHLAEKGQSKHTIHAYYRGLRRFFNWLEMRHLTSENPMEMVEAPRKSKPYPRSIGPAAVERLLRCIDPETYVGRRDRAIIIFLWDTGIRVTELCDLKVSDLEVHQGSGLIRIGKGEKFRTLCFGQKARQLLKAWSDARGETNCERVFVSRCRNPMTRSGVYYMLRRRKEEVGIAGPCNPHAFRHGFAIEFLENGGNINNLRILLGHESLRSTEIYLKATDGRAHRDHEKASPGDHLDI